MNNSKTTSKKIALIVNILKSRLKDFTLEELTTLLKNNDCPYWNRICTILISKNLLIKEKNKYNFINSSPIYYSYFESALNSIKDSQKKYTNTYKNKRTKSDIDLAIELLKNNGYKIFKEI